MKQLKLVALALTLLMGAMFTSCMDAGESGPQQWSGLVKVYDRMGYVSFLDAAGTELVDETYMRPIDAKMAVINCEINKDQKLTANSKKISIKLLDDPKAIDAQSAIVQAIGDPGDVTTNAPIMGMDFTYGYTTYKPFQFGTYNVVVLPIRYRVKDVTAEEDVKNELGRHSFTLVCYTGDIKSGDKDLTLYLRYNLRDTEEEIAKRVKYVSAFKAYDITGILYEYADKSGVAKPNKIIVKAMENPTDNKLDGTSAQEKAYEIEYKTAK